MLNQVIVVGRISSMEEIKGENAKVLEVILKVGRPYKNQEGEYENDFIKVIVPQPISNNMLEYCHIGDIVGIKGRINTHNGNQEILVEKCTFLSSNKEGKEEE